MNSTNILFSFLLIILMGCSNINKEPVFEKQINDNWVMFSSEAVNTKDESFFIA